MTTLIEGCDEIVKDFLVESYENLDQLDQDLVALEQDPGNREILASVFRTIHTIKGTCGFLDFGKLEKVAHVGENLLSKLRDGELELDANRTSALLTMIDAIRSMLSHIEDDGSEGDADYGNLIDLLTNLQQTGSGPEAAGTAPGRAPDRDVEDVAQDAKRSAETAQAGGDGTLGSAETTTTTAQAADTPQDSAKQTKDTVQAADTPQDSAKKTMATAQAAETSGTVLSPAPSPTASSLTESTIRVDVDHLDRLMNLVGELVLARNQILQFTSKEEDAAFVATSQHLNMITTELQEGVMKTRMQPIGNVWNKLPRVVRDLARSCGKDVKIIMEGKETELDKTIIEAIRDPLTHLVRNSVDHGIEIPEERQALGKAHEGTLLLRAFHEGGQVNIEITDDGGGISTEVLKKKALERSIITTEQAARMSERELLNLIFAPGFSTAKKVTKVSGRGVGMDVVRTNIEKIGGSIDLQSKEGSGTTIRIKIPLTLAIIPALIVTDSGDRFAIPQVNLLELVRLEAEQIETSIEDINGSPVYRLRGNLLPLVFLNKELKMQAAESSAAGSSAVSIVVLQADEQQFGLIVDEINDTEEIVVKPLGTQIKDLDTFAGATIMGDGKIALILDVMGLAQRAGIIGELSSHGIGEHKEQASTGSDQRRTLLVFSIGDDRRMAIPLDLVARLEEFPISSVEVAGDREVVQYRGEIMPLVRLSRFFNTNPDETEQLQVVVYSHMSRSIGFVVEEIIDIVEERITVTIDPDEQMGLDGAAVVQEKVTDLLDVDAVVGAAAPEALEPAATAEAEA